MRQYSAAKRLEFTRRLGNSWRDLADALDIPSFEWKRFEGGHEARAILEWLDERNRLSDLPAALVKASRPDLADLLDRGPISRVRRSRRAAVALGAVAVVVLAAAGFVLLNRTPESGGAVPSGQPPTSPSTTSTTGPTPTGATTTGPTTTGPATTGASTPDLAPLTASLKVDPTRGYAGSWVRLDGSGFIRGEIVRIEIVEGAGLQTFQGPYRKGEVTANANGQIRELYVVVDPGICCATGTVVIRATGLGSRRVAEEYFTLT
jgi:hypothetical protein